MQRLLPDGLQDAPIMHTLLDELGSCVLETLNYHQGELQLIVVELTVGQPEAVDGSWESDAGLPPADRIRRDIRRSTSPTRIDRAGRRIAVRFRRVVAWQVLDESFTTLDDYEQRDGLDKLRILRRSRYFDHLLKHHGWFQDVIGPATHYELCTLSDVVDVISHEPPAVELLKAV